MTSENTAEKIVPMRPDHVRLLLPHEMQMFGAEAWTRSAYLSELADRHTRSYLAVEDEAGDLLGWAGVRVIDGEAEILTVGTVPDARRRGIGRRLLTALLDVAARRGGRDVYLEVRVDNTAARSLYAAEGFTDVGLRRGYYTGGPGEPARVDAVVMHRALVPVESPAEAKK